MGLLQRPNEPTRRNSVDRGWPVVGPEVKGAILSHLSTLLVVFLFLPQMSIRCVLGTASTGLGAAGRVEQIFLCL